MTELADSCVVPGLRDHRLSTPDLPGPEAEVTAEANACEGGNKDHGERRDSMHEGG
jgi:hypothetical protein